MKKIVYFLAAALAGSALLFSCNKLPETRSGNVQQGETATLTISLSGIDTQIGTRASSTSEHNGDKTATSTQILIYDSDYNYMKKLSAAGSVTLSKGMRYYVAAIINGPDCSGVNFSDVFSHAFNLATHPYVMTGSAYADLRTESSVSVEINVTSLAGRIHLKSFRNVLPQAFGAITVKSVYLCNVAGTCGFDATPGNTWYNKYGRKDLATTITPNSVTGAVDSTVPAAASTFKDYGDEAVDLGMTLSSDAWFYTFPNSEHGNIADGLNSTTIWNEQATWLTVCGSVGGNVYYWTANLGAILGDGIGRNHSYDVSIVINNLGTSDPAIPVTPGSAGISVNVMPWVAGSEVSETI